MQSTATTPTDYGKSICVSFPYHELNLINELDKLAHQSLCSRSGYLRRLIRREKMNMNKPNRFIPQNAY